MSTTAVTVSPPDGGSDWTKRARCSTADPDVFYTRGTQRAKRVCGLCPVKDECLQDALDRDEEFGIWGGLTERERRKLKRRTG